MSGFLLQRLGQIRELERHPREAEGVLDPAVVRGPDGQLYLFPRLVARGNYSRIGIPRSPIGPRIALAVSEDLRHWKRLGLAKQHPRAILYRSVEPVLTPQMPQERWGVVSNVVFPTGIDRRDDLGSPDHIDVYYGMADKRIGVARLDVPQHLPPGAPADGDGPKTGGQG